jgi:hypothetical protein
MPVTGRGKVERVRRIHPPGRPDVYLNIDVVSKAGPHGGHTVAGPVHHLETDGYKGRKLRKKS